ncbi:MAG TPA: substrate-binding domain-containing protein [Vicinamibacteria bacterium]|nr:substrate-binding domain-containing protein [Vicinamibacteria bacterium]
MARSAAPEVGFQVIVSSDNPVTTLTRDEAARIFLKKMTRWKDGKEVVPVDQSSRSRVRATFSEQVLAVEGLEKISAVENYWRQLIYSGRGNPPAVKNSDEEVRHFVANTSGAVGYVSTGADVSGVKVVKVQETER